MDDVDDVDGGVVDDGASGGLTQNGELVSPAARLTASVASAVGVGSRRGGSTVRMKLSLNSALSSGLLLLLAAMTLASQRVAQSRSSSDATTKPAAVTSGTVSLRAMAAAGPPRYGPCALQSADQAGSSGGRYMCGFGEAKGAAGTAVWIGRAMHGSPKRRGETLKAGRRSGKRQKGSIGSGGGGGGG